MALLLGLLLLRPDHAGVGAAPEHQLAPFEAVRHDPVPQRGARGHDDALPLGGEPAAVDRQRAVVRRVRGAQDEGGQPPVAVGAPTGTSGATRR